MFDLESTIPSRSYTLKDGTVETYQPGWVQIGSSINGGIKRAITYIAAYDIPEASFKFNEQIIVVRTGDTEETVMAEWRAESARRHEAWKISPAGIKYYKQHANALRVDTKIVTDGIARLNDNILASPIQTCRWLASWALQADNVNISFDKRGLAQRLETAGYKANAFVGQAEKLNQPENMSRYIVGQAVSMMNGGMPPHPMLQHWYKTKVVPMLVKTPSRLRAKRNKVTHA